MKIVFLGDISGKPGRKKIKEVVPKIKENYEPDFIIANGENIAHGKGLTTKTIKEVTDAGINFFTTGNHVFKKSEGIDLLNDPDYYIVRPDNYPPQAPGKGYKIVEVGTKKILIANLNGRVFFREDLDCPFRAIDRILEETKNDGVDYRVVDFHAEATSEKRAMGFYLDGRVDAVFGTHTHVQTNDAQILPEGTFYITDAGMVGVKQSVLGIDFESVKHVFLTQMSKQFEIAEGDSVAMGVYVDLDKREEKGGFEVFQM